ncbi:PaaI family thioesterase [Sphingomonas sp.]|uniref:PaaI family thioesterase n=1 Tax=Sphingomonas sp. TaxID=28214 RepID=UPI00325FD09B
MTGLPPYAELLQLSPEPDPRGGPPLMLMPAHDGVLGRPGFLHGGAIAGLCEFAAFSALRAALGEPDTLMKPITVTVDYLRGGKLEATRARAEIIRLGRRIANLEVRAWQDDETRPIALARLNFLLERQPREP